MMNFICSRPLDTTFGSHQQGNEHQESNFIVVRDTTGRTVCLECSRFQLRNPRLTTKQKVALLRDMTIAMESRRSIKTRALSPMLFQEAEGIPEFRTLLQRFVETLMQQLDANEESLEYANALVDFYTSFLCLSRAMPRAMKIVIEGLEKDSEKNQRQVRMNAHLELIIRACDKSETTKRSVASYTILTKTLLRRGFREASFLNSHSKSLCADLLVRLVCCGERSTNAFADSLDSVFEILNSSNEIDITKALLLCVTQVPSSRVKKYFEQGSDRRVGAFVKLVETRLLLLDTKTSIPTLTLNLISSVVFAVPSVSRSLVSRRVHELIYELLRDVKTHGIRALLLIFRNAKIRDVASALRVVLETIESGFRTCVFSDSLHTFMVLSTLLYIHKMRTMCFPTNN
jgi:hypothetical protein